MKTQRMMNGLVVAFAVWGCLAQLGCEEIVETGLLDTPGFSVSDVSGSWVGTATPESFGQTLHISLDVDSNGTVGGSLFRAVWRIDSGGKVAGGGTMSFRTGGGRSIVADASWSLQLNGFRNRLSGGVYVEYSDFRNMTVNLIKQR